jgi:hypothetical protein
MRSRSRMYFRKQKKEKDDDEIDKDYRELEVMKINYAAEGEIVELRWQDGKFVPLLRGSQSSVNLQTLRTSQTVQQPSAPMMRNF